MINQVIKPGPAIVAGLFLALTAATPALAKDYVSQSTATDVIELYTSEGCSSCPPADEWLNDLTEHPALFQQVIPLAFHVDYWNWLGWQDPFSQQAFTQRQYQHVKQRNLSQAYTPGLLVNNNEWRAWFKGDRQWPSEALAAQQLSLTVNDYSIELTAESSGEMTATVALLGFGLVSKIGNGENRGRTLEHNFVVLNLAQLNGRSTWRFDASLLETQHPAKKLAIVGWLSEPGNVAISQAVGGYLGSK